MSKDSPIRFLFQHALRVELRKKPHSWPVGSAVASVYTCYSSPAHMPNKRVECTAWWFAFPVQCRVEALDDDRPEIKSFLLHTVLRTIG